MARLPFNWLWASNPAPDQFEEPPQSTQQSGWVGGAQGQLPEAKWENYWHHRVDAALQQLERDGAMEWLASVPYEVGAVVRHNGMNWIAAIASEGIEPQSSLDEGHWFPIIRDTDSRYMRKDVATKNEAGLVIVEAPDPSTNPVVQLRDANGDPRAMVTTIANGTLRLLVRDENGSNVAGLEIDPNGEIRPTISGSRFVGNGAGLAQLNAGGISTGTLNVDRLPSQAITTLGGLQTKSGSLRASSFLVNTDVNFNTIDQTGSGFSVTQYSTAGSLLTSRRVDNPAASFVRNSSDGAVVQIGRSTNQVGTIAVTTSSTSYNTSSDERLKDFTGEYDPDEAIQLILDNPVRTWEWNHLDGRPSDLGWGAQSLYESIPGMVSPGDTDDDLRPGDRGFEMWGVDQSKATPYLWAALAGALKKIENLEKKIDAINF